MLTDHSSQWNAVVDRPSHAACIINSQMKPWCSRQEDIRMTRNANVQWFARSKTNHWMIKCMVSQLHGMPALWTCSFEVCVASLKSKNSIQSLCLKLLSFHHMVQTEVAGPLQDLHSSWFWLCIPCLKTDDSVMTFTRTIVRSVHLMASFNQKAS